MGKAVRKKQAHLMDLRRRVKYVRCFISLTLTEGDYKESSHF